MEPRPLPPLVRRRAVLAAGRPAKHGPKLPGVQKSALSTTEDATPWDDITSYNNFFEFAGSDTKDLPSILAPEHLVTKPWSITVGGECARKGTFTLEQVLDGQALEERIYRHRCVEGWSMVIPWVGFRLASFLEKCEPTSKAAFVAFVSHYDPRQMPLSLRLQFEVALPGRAADGRSDASARHPRGRTMREALPHQDGAPIRLVVPWKYGFKSIKSIVRIQFLEQQPLGTYEYVQPRAYGFYSNVNPDVPHPQWDQSTERRIGEFFKRRTLMFNGYGEQVAHLYAGMDLRRSY